MNNPQILNFLNQYNKKEWDSIIEDLLLYSINKVNEIENIEKESAQKKSQKIPPSKKINKTSEIITFKNCKNTPYECAKNMLIQNAEYRTHLGNNNKSMKKLNDLEGQINNIKLKK